MSKRIMLGLVLFGVILSMVACSSNSAQSDEPIKATWIKLQVAGDTVSIPVSEVENNKIIHFKFGTQDKDTTFMAYKLSGELYVRANICPPCRSIGFSLQKDILVCDTCQTTFEAKTGEGIKGACVAFPKASIRYEIKNGNLAMKKAGLAVAYQNTIEPGWP